MDEKPPKRDILATFEMFVRMISLLLIPILIWVLGAWFNNQQKQMEDSRITAENTANRLTYLLKNLSSENARERKMAVVISKYLAQQNQLPVELVQVLAIIAETDSNKEVSNAAFLSLDAVATAGKEQAPAVKALLKELPGRIYIHIPNKGLMNRAKQIEATLVGNGYQVPGIEVVSKILSKSQIRYFHVEDKAEAEKIMNLLLDQGNQLGVLSVAGYENKVRNRQFEIWISGK